MELQTAFLSEPFHANVTLELWFFVTFIFDMVVDGGGIFVFPMACSAAVKCTRFFFDFVIKVITYKPKKNEFAACKYKKQFCS